jgi:hypothetical protein
MAQSEVRAPVRVQLSRTPLWRMPANTLKVDRTTRWGNPFRITPRRPAVAAVAAYRRWLLAGRATSGAGAPPTLADIRAELKGHNLACWCAAHAPCHADVLLELANCARPHILRARRPRTRTR